MTLMISRLRLPSLNQSYHYYMYHENLVNQQTVIVRQGILKKFSSSPSESLGKLFQEFLLSEAKCSVEIMVSNQLNSKTTVRLKLHNFLMVRK